MVYHLSHTDLDGYGCQFITQNYFEKIAFFNSNYGNEIDTKLEKILNSIRHLDEECMLLITDLNLSLSQANALQTSIKELNSQSNKVTLQLLDHHKSGEDSANAHAWYYLDNTRSATKITYDFFFKGQEPKENFTQLIESINAYDIWLSENPLFEMGKVLASSMDILTKDINRVLFPQEESAYIFAFLDRARQYFQNDEDYIRLDEELYFVRKEFLNLHGRRDTFDNIIVEYIADLLTKKRDDLTIYYKNAKGVLTYNIGSVSTIGNGFLVQNEDFDFFMNVSTRGTFSLRSNNKIDVSLIARELAGGGGHKNAAGGKLSDFRESFLYEDIKRVVEEKLV